MFLCKHAFFLFSVVGFLSVLSLALWSLVCLLIANIVSGNSFNV